MDTIVDNAYPTSVCKTPGFHAIIDDPASHWNPTAEGGNDEVTNVGSIGAVTASATSITNISRTGSRSKGCPLDFPTTEASSSTWRWNITCVCFRHCPITPIQNLVC